MKKYTFLALAAIFAALNTHSQTLNGSAFPSIGSIYSLTLADTTGIQPGNSGMGVTWDFSTLVNSGKTQVDSFLLPSATPYGVSFPTATIAIHDVQPLSDYYIYYHDNGTAYQRIGNVQPDMIIYSDPADEYQYPVSYSNMFHDTYYAAYTSTSSGDVVHMSGIIDINADGTGTVITPAGTYTNVLRITGIRNEHDTIFGTPNITIHLVSTYTDWYQPVLYYPVMSIVSTKIYSIGPTSSQKTVGYRAGVPAGINEQKIAGTVLDVFPNPSSTGFFHFQLRNNNDRISQLYITDLTGRVVYTAPGSTDDVNLAGTANGIYFYHIQTLNGVNISGKIILQ